MSAPMETRTGPESGHNADYERVVLGCMLTAPQAIVEVEHLGVTSEDFYVPRHGALFAALVDAREEGRPTEPTAMAGQLQSSGMLAQVGGAPYLHTVYEAAVPGQVGWYARQLRDMADRRRVLQAIATVGQAAAAPGITADRLAAIAETVITAAAPRVDGLEMVSLGEFASIGTADIEMRKGRRPGLSTGLSDLDKLLGGLRAGQLVVIAGRPGMGKTTLAMDVARRVSIRDHRVTAWFALEMTTQEMFDRCLSAESGVEYHRIRDGELDDADWERASRALGPMSEAPMFFDDTTGQTTTEITRKIRALQNRVGLDLVVLDYLQLVKSHRRVENRQQEVAEVARWAKELGGRLHVPVVALVQLNRDSEKRPDKVPQLSDIRDSGEVEQAAHAVLMVHRPDKYDPECERAGEGDIYVRKNRGGAEDVVTVASQLHRCRFVDLAIV